MAFLLLQYNLLLLFLLLSIGVQEELKELGLWKFAGGIMYIMQEVFGMPASRLIVPLSEKYMVSLCRMRCWKPGISEGMMPGIGLVGHSLDIISKGCIGI